MMHGHLLWKRPLLHLAAVACTVGLAGWVSSCRRNDLSKPAPAEEYGLSAAELVSLTRLANSGNGNAAIRLTAGEHAEAVKWFEKAKADFCI